MKALFSLRSIFAALAALSAPLHAQQYQWTSFAGKPGGIGVSGTTASTARFNAPRGVAFDASGNLFVADTYNDIIRKITPSGVVSIFAGKAQTTGSANGAGANARFNRPHQIAFGPGGVLYVADKDNSCIRKITPAGVVATLAGQPGSSGSADGTGAAAQFRGPEGLALDASGNLFVADTGANTIRKVTPAGVVTTLAGTAGVTGSADGTGPAASFKYPQRIVLSGGNLYVTDSGNSTIRKVTLAGEVTTFAGQAGSEGSADGPVATARFSYPLGLASDAGGNLYVGQDGDATIRKITPAGVVSTLAGSPGVWGYEDATGAAARFNGIYSMAVNASGTLFAADAGNQAIRKVTASGVVTTYAGVGASYGSADGTGTAARFSYPEGMAMNSSGDLFVADSSNHTIRRVTQAGVVTTYAGTAGTSGSTDGPAASALFRSPQGLAFDTSGNLLVADRGNAVLRRITPAGEVSTLAGLAGQRGIVDGTGSVARFDTPTDVAVDTAGNAYVTEWSQHLIRKVTPAGEVTIVAGSIYGQVDGMGTAAKFAAPIAIAADGGGNIYMADFYGHTIRKMSPTYQVTTVAGLPGTFGSKDGLGNVARFNYPDGVAANGQGTIFVTDYGNNTIRRISSAGVVSTIGGLSGTTDATDGLGSAARFATPQRIFAAPDGSLYVTDYNHHIIKGVPLPDITIQQPAGVDLIDNKTISFGSVPISQTAVKTFTIRNDSDAKLTGLALTVNGANAADFTASSLGVTSLAPGASVTFDITFHANTAGTRTAAAHITSNDADESPFDILLTAVTDVFPVVVTAPESEVKSIGDSVTFESAATHPLLSITYQWKKNGSSIAGATSQNLTLNDLSLSSAATYSVVMTAGGKSVTRSASLAIVQPTAVQVVLAKAGSTVKLTAANITGSGTFLWKRNGAPLPGSNTKTLTLSAVTAAANTALYDAFLVRGNGMEVPATSFNLRVFDAKPAIITPQNLPDGAVGSFYSHQIKVNTSPSLSPSTFAAKNLPPGVTLNTKTGLISGVPTVAKNYDLIVSAGNSYGTVTAPAESITITSLPTGVIGSFMGMVRAKGVLGGGLDGRIDFTCASTGAISGSTVMAGIKYPFKGNINTEGAKPVSAITILRPQHLPITLNLVFDPGLNALDPTSSMSVALVNAGITAWRQVWRTTGALPLNPATTLAQRYNFVLNPSVAAGVPEGSGYGSFILATNGTLTATGKTPEGDTFTTAGFAGPLGQVLVYQSLFANRGKLLGILDIDPNDSTLPDRYLEGSLVWSRPADTASRYSPNGFSTTLTAYGARYTAPVAPTLILGMELGNKVILDFSGGGLSTASINPNVAEFDIIAGNKAVMPTPKAGNPGNVKFVTLNATTGEFSGTFTLSDNELRTGAAFVGKKFSRTVTFNGVLTEDSMGHVGAGFFLLPELPTDTTTPTKTLIRSGYVQMQKKP